MVFNGESNNLDIVSDVHFWCGTNSTSYPTVDITRHANFAVDRVVSLIMKFDDSWEFDDGNQTDLPIATTSLVADQHDYSLTFGTHVKILRVRVKDQSGTYFWTIDKVKREELDDYTLQEQSSMPRCYDQLANSLYLWPASSYNSSGGLEMQYQRSSNYFVYTDTTKTPGFAPQFHRLVSLGAAQDYLIAKDVNPNRLKAVQLEILKLETELQRFYGERVENSGNRLQMAGIDSR